MSSSIFFRFKSQKDNLSITFDGTSLSVFEVKRDIIGISKLGDGTDFDLEIYSADNTSESEQTNTIILMYLLTYLQDTMTIRRKYRAPRRSSRAGCQLQDLALGRLRAMLQGRCPSTQRMHTASRI